MNNSLNQPKNSLNGLFFIIFAAMLWGTTGTSQALGPESSNPLAVGTLRLLCAGIFLLIFSYCRGGFREKRTWSILLVSLGALFVSLYQVTFFAAVAKTGVAIGTVVGIGSSPIFAGCFEAVILKKYPSKSWFISTFIAILGCAILAFSNQGQESMESISIFGICLAICAGMAYAAYSVVLKVLIKTSDSMEVTAVVFCIGAVLLSPLLFYVDISWAMSFSGIIMILYLGIFATSMAYVLFGKGLETVPASTAVTLTLTEPLTAAFLGVMVLGESLNVMASCGLVLIFGSVFILTFSRKG